MTGSLLQERGAVVTGADHGIGGEIAWMLIGRGAEVLPAYVDGDLAKQEAFEVGGGRLM
jgi:NAD(P)-dependent dehydrogenase (short-subunit alcohol dehydrogenase family)